MSWRTELYNQIWEKLNDNLDVFTNAELTPIKFFDLFFEQYFTDDIPATEYPALYLEFGEIQYRQSSRNVQVGEAKIILHLVVKNFLNTKQSATQQSQASKILEYSDLLHHIIGQITGDDESNYGKLVRLNEMPTRRDKGLYATQITYQVSLKGDTAVKRYTLTGNADEIIINKEAPE